MLASYFVLLIKHLPWLQQYFVVTGEATAASHAHFLKKTRIKLASEVKFSRPIPSLMKQMLILKLHNQEAAANS